MQPRFIHKKFSELELHEIYQVMALRQKVFVVEQNCPYLDADGKDQDSHHVMGFDQASRLVAYARIVPPEISYANYSSIGRVVIAHSVRGTGTGKLLMQYTIEQTKDIHPAHNIKISAQVYILKFYRDLGFVEQGEEYLEDDIPHKAMTLVVNT